MPTLLLAGLLQETPDCESESQELTLRRRRKFGVTTVDTLGEAPGCTCGRDTSPVWASGGWGGGSVGVGGYLKNACAVQA